MWVHDYMKESSKLERATHYKHMFAVENASIANPRVALFAIVPNFSVSNPLVLYTSSRLDMFCMLDVFNSWCLSRSCGS